MVGYIYLITDTTNGMKYTGKHHYHIEGQLDPNYHGSGVIIKNIYKKRPETLKEEYIKTCYSEEEMCSDEQYYIKLFKTLYPNGYNLTEGGEGEIPCEETRRKLSKAHKGKPAHNKGVPMSKEQKKKLSEANRGKHHSEETKKKMSESLKGRPSGMLGKKHSEESKKKMGESRSGKKNPFYSKHHTEETRKKISTANKGKQRSEETRRKMSKARINGKCSKKVLQFTLDGELIKEWPSVMECSRNGYDFRNVSACCRGKLKTAYGYKWMYADDYIE